MVKRRKRGRKRSFLVPALLIFVCLTLVPASFILFGNDSVEALNPSLGDRFDSRAEVVKKPLFKGNSKNKNGDFSYEILKNIVFEGDSQVGNIDLKNPYCNNYDMYLELSLKEDEKVFLRTGLIPPGSKITAASPDYNLPLGEYDGTAVICAVEKDGEELMGFLTEDVKIKVKK